MKKNLSFFPVLIFIVAFFSSGVLADLQFSITPSTVNESSNLQYNLTVNNSNQGSEANLTSVVLVFDYADLAFVEGSNVTDTSSEFNNTNLSEYTYLNWSNFTGFVVNGGSVNFFAFNLTGIYSGVQKILVMAVNGSGVQEQNVTVEVLSSCGAYSDNTTCDADSSCAWSKNFDRCGPSCLDYSDVDSCEDASGYCMWDEMAPDGPECMFMPFSQSTFGCDISNETLCEAHVNCTWEKTPEMVEGMCIVDCFQFDSEEGGNETACNNSYGGNVCVWQPDWYCVDHPDDPKCTNSPGICDPFFFDKGFDGFSPCFEFDGNKSACDSMTGECVWFSEPNCNVGDWCYDNSSSDHGFCNPEGGFNFGGDFDCWVHDGNKNACKDSMEQSQWPCNWNPDPWGPLINGTESGWCSMFFGGGGSGGGSCWDYHDEDGCNSALAMGLPCNWQSSNGAVCEQKGCWDYWDSSSCNAHANESCIWNDQQNYCYEKKCWDLTNISACGSADNDFGLDCTWYNNSWGDGGRCEENGCWNRDWTNQSYCEAKAGCYWDGNNHCYEKGCWDYDGTNQSACENKTLTGLDCRWNTQVTGWCEEQGCWSYQGTNQSACENTTATFGMDCIWSNSSGQEECFEQIKSCPDYDNEFGCFGTGWCTWNGTDCEEPNFNIQNFWNPGCWVFDQAGEVKCSNVTTCSWSGGACTDNGADDNQGVQCSDINESVMCNNIPMLSTCCQWNGTGCQDAPMIDSCHDLQEPPEGAKFCEDYNSRTSQTLCNQIAGEPWYMPCEWNNATEECRFAGDDMFGGSAHGFEFDDIGSKANCEATGGFWKEEKWMDENGSVFWEKWCEPKVGFGAQFCDDACWACEQQNNGSEWGSVSAARGACEGSSKGCVFHEDSNSYNGYGWCDLDFGKQGNCDQNCWECWETEQCGESAAGCKWFVDPWNDNFGWCDSKNVKTCDDDCFMCWDMSNCQASAADCSWNADSYFCQPKGTGEGGDSYEVCFDGVDNDNDEFTDCKDPECMFSEFCGGSAVFGAAAGAECSSITVEGTCTNGSKHPGYNCTWVTDPWNNSWCDVPGAQCWIYDDNSTACDAENGCQYQTMHGKGEENEEMCDVNKSFMEIASCWDHGENETVCNAQSGCAWQTDKWCLENPSDPWCSDFNATNGYLPGWCDNELWSCFSYDGNESACNLQPHCAWQTDWWCSTPEGANDPWCDNNPGWCDPVCFNRSSGGCEGDVNISGTVTSGVCELKNASEMGWCESENNFDGCWEYDDNETECNLANMSCTWIADPFIPGGGFCGDLFMKVMTEGMDQSDPFYFEMEDCAGGADATRDICEVGVKDSPEKFGLVTRVNSMADSVYCNHSFNFDPSFTGNKSSRFYWYMDSNGVETGGCNASDNSSLTGFDLKFKHETSYVDGEFNEVRVAYKCLNGTWSPSQIKTNVWPEKMCYRYGGGVLSVDKESVKKLKNYFNETATMRIYAVTGSETNPTDVLGPKIYTPRSADFRFEDCSGLTDTDGDGLVPSDDPDCTDFLRNGFVDLEKGAQCGDGIDNDGNGLTDCTDPGCMYDVYYCNSSYYENDNTAPKTVWMETHTFFDGAFVELDTDEPTNSTVYFFRNDSYCANSSNAIKIYSWKLNNSFTADDFDFWHDFSVENSTAALVAASYPIESNATYYFKVKVCDRNSNCALSACTNFTTRVNASEYRVGFDLPPVGSNVSEFLGKLEVQFDWERDGSYEDKIDGVAGFKVNETKGRDVDLKFHNPNSSEEWGVEFLGADFVKAQDLNLTGAFIVNESLAGDPFVGMDGDKWELMAQTLGVDEIEIIIPVDLDNPSNAVLMHCPDNVTDVSVAQGCKEINLSDVNCTFGFTNTTCTVPTSIGFSVFGVLEDVVSVTPEGDTGTGGAGGGGGLGGAAPVANATDNETLPTEGVSEGVGDALNGEALDGLESQESEEGLMVPEEGSKFWIWASVFIMVGLAGGAVAYFFKKK